MLLAPIRSPHLGMYLAPIRLPHTGMYLPPIRLCIYHRPSPGGGDPGQIQRWMGTYTGIWTINLPWRRGKWGRFVFQKPCTAGKTGDFANETGQFQVVLNDEKWRKMKTAVQKNVVHLSPRVCDGDLGGWRRYCNVNPFPSCYFRYCLLQIWQWQTVDY